MSDFIQQQKKLTSGQSLSDIFRNVQSYLQEQQKDFKPLPEIEQKIVQKIQERVKEISRRVLSLTYQDFFNFLGITTDAFENPTPQTEYENFYKTIIALEENDFSSLLQETSKTIASGRDFSEPPSPRDLNPYAPFFAQCIFSMFGSDTGTCLERLSKMVPLSPIARQLYIYGEEVEAIKDIQEQKRLDAYVYEKYFLPFLSLESNSTRDARCQSSDFLDRFSTEKSPASSELHVFSFNVGQGNCIILRHGSESVIIDAGKGVGMGKGFERFVQPKIISLLKETQLKAIFITHPHTDHYNLIENLMDIAEPEKIFLGGTLENWERGKKDLGILWNKIKEKNIFFVTNKVYSGSYGTCPSILLDIFTGTQFQFILPHKDWKRDQNTCSFFLKVFHGKNSFLFTGDAEGENLEEITGHVYTEDHSRLLRKAIAPEFKSYIRKPDFHHEQLEMSLYKKNREALQNIGVVFVPHHGTDSKASQDVMTRLSGLDNPPATFVINSVVTNKDKNPPASTVSMVNKDYENPPHAVTFFKNDQEDYKFTNRYVYDTEAAPGGAYWFMSVMKGFCFTMPIQKAFRERVILEKI